VEILGTGMVVEHGQICQVMGLLQAL